MTVFERLAEILAMSGVPHVMHRHEPARTVDDMVRNPLFAQSRIVKTIAFRTRSGRIVLAALRGDRRVDYPRLAAILGINRRDLAPLSPEEVRIFSGMGPGSVSPIPLNSDSSILIDDDVLTIEPTLFCGIGRSDRTLEIAPADLVRLSRGRVAGFSK